ncbi:MAG: TlpA disulfide reductase family protein [Terriglobales bacterium]
MAALTVGTKAPDFCLSALDDSKFSLEAALRQGPVVAVFFKVSCPVCQYAFPFFEKLHEAYSSQKVTIVGVSQDNARDTAAFLRDYGVTFRTLLDDPNGYAVSNAYGLTNVPTLFLIEQDGAIKISNVGWVKQDIDDVNARLATVQQTPLLPLFRPSDDVRDFRAG